jgi:hypothetical protein
MSIIKWRPNMDDIEKALAVVKKAEIERPSPGQAGSYLEIRRQAEIIDRVFEVRPAVQPRFTVNYNPPAIAYGEANTPVIRDQIELPRMCASRRMPYMVRYISAGRWEYSCSVRVDPQTQHELYGCRVHDTLQFTSDDAGYETCAWCGAVGRGGIQCLGSTGCGTFTCHGTIYQRASETWSRCVCGRDGRLTMNHTVQTGIFPKVRAR